ncbi:MAG: alpha-(1-_3)-arabinofuranosyltransferase domain-containing protein, partial [Phycicoccus sp.]
MNAPVDAGQRWRRRLDRLLPTVFLMALAFVQRPGWTAADTKLDLVLDPGGFLARSVSLWDPLAAGGQLQNQAYGYLFPMGPFFWVGDTVGLPGWVVQRCWWALLLVVAYHGALLVLERLGIGSTWSRVIGAFAYALAPRMVMGLGAISSEIWPMALAPWILAPLIAPVPGRERAAALRSGVAVLLLGAVNAVASLAVLVLPLWWILTRRGRVRRLLLGWWVLAVGLATAWWIGPLLLLGRYSPPFLDWIEDSRVTTAVASVTEALRGTTQWIATIGGADDAVWPGGWVLLTSRNAMLFGLVIVCAGLLGLALAQRPWSAFARGGLALGLVLVTFGHSTGVAGPWAEIAADLLDGVLAPFRNTHKFEPVIRLPVVIGVAHGLPWAVDRLRRSAAPWPRIAPALVVLALVGQTAVPAFVGVIQRGPFVAVPRAWEDAARWLGDHPDGRRTLVLPGGNAPARLWGDPKDEPLQPHATQPWIVRDAVPLGSAGATRLLNEIEARVAQGRGGPELLSLLDTLAVNRVLLAADHQRVRSRTTPPVV